MKVDQAVKFAKKKTEEGFVEEATRIYADILTKFPTNKNALKGIQNLKGISTKITNNIQNPSNEQMHMVLSLYNQGDYHQVLAQTNALLKLYPNSDILYNIFGAANIALQQFHSAVECYKKAISINPSNIDAHNNLGLALQGKGDLDAAIESYKKVLKIDQDFAEVYYNMGLAFEGKGDPKSAIYSYKKAIRMKPDNADAHNNLGLVFQGEGEVEAAIDSFKQALQIRPDYAEAYNNMGFTLQAKGDFDAAIDSYKKAISINPDNVDALNDMGLALQKKGDLEAAIDGFEKALQIKPDYTDAKTNLVTLLSNYIPKKEVSHPIAEAERKIRVLDLKYSTSKRISDNEVISLFVQSSKILKSFKLKIDTLHSQIYRRNTIESNCRRHMGIFELHQVIPEFCFGCYKVQVEPSSFIDLMKLHVVFDKLKLEENNSRKCMVELRPEISGFYKGLVYCDSLEQANTIAEHLDHIIKENIGSQVSAKIKRGCSEYPISFPDYKEINYSGPQLMNYNQDWKSIEEDYDKKHPAQVEQNRITTPNGLSLNDFLIMRNWFDYAKGIGDESANLIDKTGVFSNKMYNSAKMRTNMHPFNH